MRDSVATVALVVMAACAGGACTSTDVQGSPEAATNDLDAGPDGDSSTGSEAATNDLEAGPDGDSSTGSEAATDPCPTDIMGAPCIVPWTQGLQGVCVPASIVGGSGGLVCEWLQYDAGPDSPYPATDASPGDEPESPEATTNDLDAGPDVDSSTGPEAATNDLDAGPDVDSSTGDSATDPCPTDIMGAPCIVPWTQGLQGVCVPASIVGGSGGLVCERLQYDAGADGPNPAPDASLGD